VNRVAESPVRSQRFDEYPPRDQPEALLPVADEASLGRSDRTLARHGALTFLFSSFKLAANVVTGVVVARALGASGRGQLAAILTVTQLVGWTCTLGCGEATAYHQARHRGSRGVVGAWLVLMLPAGLLAVLVGEALLPVLLHAQTESTLRLARLFMLSAFLAPVGALLLGILLGTHRYLFFNVISFLQPLATAVSYLGLWWLGALSPSSALVATVLVSLAVAAVMAASNIPGRVGRPDWAGGLPNIWYGIRAHATNLSGMANTRLDLMIIPAFLAASSVGLYSVATNVSWIIVSTTGAFAAIVLPAAARDPQGGVMTVVRSLQATFVAGCILALGVALFAEIALRLLYGSEFARVALALRLLLPGSVCWACSGVLRAGLEALNKPLTAAACQAVGLVLTVSGLLLFLDMGGITAAAIVSTVAYAVVFISSLLLYRRAAQLSWRELFTPPDFAGLGALGRVVTRS
jgi:O-antigen/teichoic acid export membrane protein